MRFIVLLIMALSKKNLNQLKSFLNKKNTIKNNIDNKNLISDSTSLSNYNPVDINDPDQIFYSIIDNSEHLEDTILNNNKLKRIKLSEIFLIKIQSLIQNL